MVRWVVQGACVVEGDRVLLVVIILEADMVSLDCEMSSLVACVMWECVVDM